MTDDLDKNILGTICYFDVLGYPVTVFEIWKYLIDISGEEKEVETIGIKDILDRLNDDRLKIFIDCKDGFYFLKNQEFLVERRIRRDKISVSKIKRFRRIAWLMRVVPFVRMIAITGRLAMKNAKPDSDWDVLIALKGGRIWIGRTLVTLWTHLIGKRRHHDRIKDRVCLNYFITTDSLEIRNKDLFSANEYFFCIPIFGTEGVFEKFQIRNSWIRNYKPNYYLSGSENLKSVRDDFFSNTLRNLGEKIFDWDFLENYLGKIETEKINNNPKTKKEEGLIAVDNSALIFLPEPQGPKVFEDFKNKINNLV